MSAPAVEVRDLTFRYGDRVALNGVSFAVGQGEIFGLLGPNGGGKTTLFRILSTLLSPAAGQARIFGLDVSAEPLEVRRRIGVVFQNQSLDRRLSVQENLECQGRLYGLTGAALKDRIGDALARTKLTDRRGDKVDTLSGGLRRRVELAKGLLHQPQLLLLDEPSTGVDPAVRLDFWEHLQRLRSESGATILLTTHLLEEADKCDRLAILDRGSIVATGTPAELKEGIGGDVITLTAPDLEAVRESLAARLGVSGQVVDGAVRFEHPRGAEAVAGLMHALPTSVQSISVAKPTLEDVFIAATGRSFGEDEAPAA
ncbi:MAG: ATP-binding cassette domain-containing protein [Acidobacteria bacterium]|nr:ATP-binding cassette domain-containing protein [Acidobacteriota bacterium]